MFVGLSKIKLKCGLMIMKEHFTSLRMTMELAETEEDDIPGFHICVKYRILRDL